MDATNDTVDDFQFEDPNINKQYEDALLLRTYYEKTFPWDLLYEWLSLNHQGDSLDSQAKYFAKREFSVAANRDKKEIIKRHVSFPKVNQLQELTMGYWNPSEEICHPFDRIDIGPIYSEEPSKKSLSNNYHPVERELVFDIDINDYDDVRVCCKGQTLCVKCWGLLSLGAKHLTHQLNTCYGFKKFLYVFSGGRGLHIWISDKSAVTLTFEMRRALVSYLNIDGSTFCPHLEESYNLFFLPYFENHMIEEQMILSDEKQLNKFLDRFPESYGKKQEINIRADVQRVLKENENESDINKWFAIKESLATYKDKVDYEEIIFRVVMYYTHPRVDEPVTTILNHLAKSPFCIHPRTKKLCVPIEFSEIDEFDPNEVPTLTDIAQESFNNRNNKDNNSMDIDSGNGADDEENKKSSKKKKNNKKDHSFRRYRQQFSIYVNSISKPDKMDEDKPINDF